MARDSKKEEEEEDDDMYNDLSTKVYRQGPEAEIIIEEELGIQEGMIEIQEEREMAEDDQPQQAVQQAQGHGKPSRKAWQVTHGPWREKEVRLSP